jgi:acyl-CoA reductase-like NAD-dependent aldehyde dehydrogenase
MERNMTTFNEKIIYIETGEEIIEPYNDEQLAELAKATEKKAESDAEAATKAAQRAAVFERLGITEEEAKLLLG